MEKILVKTGIYSFVISFFLLVVFMKIEKSITDIEGMTSIRCNTLSRVFL